MRNGIFRGKGVEHKLKIRRSVGRLSLQMNIETEQLHVADGNLSLQQRKEIELGRQAGYLEQFFLCLVVQQKVVDNNPVQKAHVDTAYRNAGRQERRKLTGHYDRQLLLNIRNIQQQNGAYIQGKQGTQYPPYYTFYFFDRQLIFLFSEQKYKIKHYPSYFYHYFCSD